MFTFEVHVRVEATALSPVKNDKGCNGLEWPYVTGAMRWLDGDDDDDDDDDDDESLEMGGKIFKI